jgi:AraC-like DNA-binding protein
MSTAFDHSLKIDGVTVEYCNTLTPREREIHPYHELLFCVRSDLVLRTENSRIALSAPCFVLIPAGCYHLFDLSGRTSFHRLKLAFDAEMIGALPLRLFSCGVSVLSAPDQDVLVLADKICCAMREDETETRRFLIYAATLMLLAELNAAGAPHSLSHTSNNEIIFRVTRYIAAHPEADLSVEALAARENVSPSYLSHTFKKELGISLHRYVVQRRMIYARERISTGEKPSKIFTECGYGDYSSFYKAYVQFFDAPPSKE